MAINLQIMSKVQKLFVDADAFVALNDQKDPNYQHAVTFSSLASSSRIPLITSDPAFGEAITVISQNINLRQAIQFAEEILASSIEIVEVDPGLRKAGLEIFKKQTSKNSRFTDCINMAIMKKMSLNTIFSFDVQYKKNKLKRFGIDE